jgi:hypothetical protein
MGVQSAPVERCALVLRLGCPREQGPCGYSPLLDSSARARPQRPRDGQQRKGLTGARRLPKEKSCAPTVHTDDNENVHRVLPLEAALVGDPEPT